MEFLKSNLKLNLGYKERNSVSQDRNTNRNRVQDFANN